MLASPGGRPRRSRRGRRRPRSVAGASARRLRLRCPNAHLQQLRAARAAAASGSAASVIARTTTARRAPALDDGGQRVPASSPPIANHGLLDRCAPRRRRSRGPRPGGPAWSASRAPGRRRGSRRRGRRRPRRPARARASSARRSGPARPRARACAGVPSSWPTCTPSAAHASTRSGRSLRMNSAPCASAAARNACAAVDQPVVVERLVAQLDHVDAAAQRGVEERPRPRVADEVQAGVRQALAGGHAGSLAALRLRSITGARRSG